MPPRCFAWRSQWAAAMLDGDRRMTPGPGDVPLDVCAGLAWLGPLVLQSCCLALGRAWHGQPWLGKAWHGMARVGLTAERGRDHPSNQPWFTSAPLGASWPLQAPLTPSGASAFIGGQTGARNGRGRPVCCGAWRGDRCPLLRCAALRAADTCLPVPSASESRSWQDGQAAQRAGASSVLRGVLPVPCRWLAGTLPSRGGPKIGVGRDGESRVGAGSCLTSGHGSGRGVVLRCAG